jgi:predicted Ser/Thr protein kinase
MRKNYPKQKDALKESEVLKAAQESPIVPKLYETGANYNIIEYLEGPSLIE